MSPRDDLVSEGSLGDEGQPTGEFSTSDADAGGGLDQALSPPDEPRGLDEYGTTAAEEREGERLSTRLEREEPDTFEDAGDGSRSGAAGRLVDPGSEEVDSVDTTPEALARDAGYETGELSAEEAAVRIEE